jgi:hypothetical protein
MVVVFEDRWLLILGCSRHFTHNGKWALRTENNMLGEKLKSILRSSALNITLCRQEFHRESNTRSNSIHRHSIIISHPSGRMRCALARWEMFSI